MIGCNYCDRFLTTYLTILNYSISDWNGRLLNISIVTLESIICKWIFSEKWFTLYFLNFSLQNEMTYNSKTNLSKTCVYTRFFSVFFLRRTWVISGFAYFRNSLFLTQTFTMFREPNLLGHLQDRLSLLIKDFIIFILRLVTKVVN
jgi:hypothetical protein